MSTFDDYESLFKGNFLKASDLEAPSLKTIEKVGTQELGGELKGIITFDDGTKLVMNKTNNGVLRQLFGKADKWPGKQIVVYPTETSFQSKVVPCLRLRAPKNKQATSMPADDFSDSLANI
jgi:hypothetical protein